MAEQLLSVADAADQLGVSPRRVRQLVDEGDLEASRFGRSWAVSAESVARRQRLAPSSGRPLDSHRVWGVAFAVDGMVENLAKSLRRQGMPNVEWLRQRELERSLRPALSALSNIQPRDLVRDDDLRDRVEVALRSALEAIGRDDRRRRMSSRVLPELLAMEERGEYRRGAPLDNWLEKFGEDRASAERAAVKRLRNSLAHDGSVSAQDLAAFRNRAEGVLGFHAHPSIHQALIDDEVAVYSGAHAAASYGADLVPGDHSDLYLNSSFVPDFVKRHFLEESPLQEANVWIRPVESLHVKGWPAPRLLVAADLLERGGPRERGAALQLLDVVQSAIAWHEGL